MSAADTHVDEIESGVTIPVRFPISEASQQLSLLGLLEQIPKCYPTMQIVAARREGRWLALEVEFVAPDGWDLVAASPGLRRFA